MRRWPSQTNPDSFVSTTALSVCWRTAREWDGWTALNVGHSFSMETADGCKPVTRTGSGLWRALNVNWCGPAVRCCSLLSGSTTLPPLAWDRLAVGPPVAKYNPPSPLFCCCVCCEEDLGLEKDDVMPPKLVGNAVELEDCMGELWEWRTCCCGCTADASAARVVADRCGDERPPPLGRRWGWGDERPEPRLEGVDAMGGAPRPAHWTFFNFYKNHGNLLKMNVWFFQNVTSNLFEVLINWFRFASMLYKQLILFSDSDFPSCGSRLANWLPLRTIDLVVVAMPQVKRHQGEMAPISIWTRQEWHLISTLKFKTKWICYFFIVT